MTLKRKVLAYAVSIVLLLVGYVPAESQCDSLYQLTLLDTTRAFYPMVGGVVDTQAPVPKSLFVPGHQFSFQSDTVTVMVNVLEYRLNRRTILLKDWCHKKTWNWSKSTDTDTLEYNDQQLSQRSRTQTFPLTAGDTISVFRWYAVIDAMQDTFSFERSDQTLSSWLSVELVNASNGNVIAVVDSTRFSSVNGRLCIHGLRPAIARIVYVVPASQSPTSAFIRVRVGNEAGNNLHWFRFDDLMDAVSYRMLGNASSYNTRFEQGNACSSTGVAAPVMFIALQGQSGIRCTTQSSEQHSVVIVGSDGFTKATIVVGGSTQSIDVLIPPGLYYSQVYNAGGVFVGTNNILVN